MDQIIFQDGSDAGDWHAAVELRMESEGRINGRLERGRRGHVVFSPDDASEQPERPQNQPH